MPQTRNRPAGNGAAPQQITQTSNSVPPTGDELITWTTGYLAGYDQGEAAGYTDGYAAGRADADRELVEALAHALSNGAATDYRQAVRIHNRTVEAVQRRQRADRGELAA